MKESQINKFLLFINERIETASSNETKSAYILVKDNFTKIIK